MIIIDDDIILEEKPINKNRKSNIRRKNDRKKAKRKVNILRHALLYKETWIKPSHYYSKNKVHCSCPLCAMKRKYGDIPLYEQKANEKMDSMLTDIDYMEDSY